MKKSQFRGFVLALIFGPLGLFYSSVAVGALLVVAAALIGFLSGEVPIGLWPISVAVSIVTVRRHNLRLREGPHRVRPKAENVGREPVHV